MKEPKYRLKKTAVPFFDEKYAVDCETLDFWTSEKVNFNALEKVDDNWIEYGKSINLHSATLSGWDSNNGDPIAHFEFTAYLRGIDGGTYDKIKEIDISTLITEFEKHLKDWAYVMKFKSAKES